MKGPVSSLAVSSTVGRRFWDSASGNDGVGWMNAFIWFSFAMTHFRFGRF